jgi:hypothetical protein
LLSFFADPDIVSGDGIYSRYLGRYLDAGRYKFTINVDDNDNNAIYIDNADSQIKPKTTNHNIAKNGSVNFADLFYNIEIRRGKCCGSSVIPALELESNPKISVKTGIFRRSVLGPVVHMTEPVKQSDDQVPPARIGDLKIRQLPGASTQDRLLAEWTAPGGDFNVGSVASYRFVFSSRIRDLLDGPHAGQPDVLLGFDRMERAGTAAKFDFNFPHYDKDFYVGAYGFDVAGNRGKISNLVHVRIAAPSYGGKRGRGQEAEPIMASATPTEPNWVLIGAISGVIGVLLLLSIVAISYYVGVARKRSVKTGSTSSVMGGGPGSASDETDSSSFDSDIKNIMANPLGPAIALPRHVHLQHQQHHHHHQHHLTSPQATPTDTNSTNVTPVYWSASQLLSKLDSKPALQTSYHASPYNNYFVPQGPQSLQPAGISPSAGQPSAAAGQPASLHNLSYDTQRTGYPSWSYRQNIPEEYTITVTEDTNASPVNHEKNNRAAPRLANPKASCSKVRPPVMPKPRNITQV